jgi:hypothetical protein
MDDKSIAGERHPPGKSLFFEEKMMVNAKRVIIISIITLEHIRWVK